MSDFVKRDWKIARGFRGDMDRPAPPFEVSGYSFVASDADGVEQVLGVRRSGAGWVTDHIRSGYALPCDPQTTRAGAVDAARRAMKRGSRAEVCASVPVLNSEAWADV